jgi:MFS family permease
VVVHEVAKNALFFKKEMLTRLYLSFYYIVATALPSIVKDLGKCMREALPARLKLTIEMLGGASRYSWVGTAYLLTSAACAPAYGVISVRNYEVVQRRHSLILTRTCSAASLLSLEPF